MINKPINVAASVLITYQFYQFTIQYNLQEKVKVKLLQQREHFALMIFSYISYY